MDASLFSLYRDDWIIRCLGTAGYTCLVYDHVLTFDKEIEFIWQAPWTFTKATFLVHRYGNLVGQTVLQFVKVSDQSTEFCDVPSTFIAVYGTFCVESIHILVLLRAWAIWGCEKRVAIVLIGSYSVYFLFFLVNAVFGTMSATVRRFKYATLPEICIIVIPSNVWLLALATGCQDTAVFAVTMISLWRHSKTSKHLYPTSLLFTLIHDAVIFYISSILFSVVNAIMWTKYTSSPLGADLSTKFALNLLSITGQRLVLNLRGFTVRTYGSRSLSVEVDRQLQMFSGTRLEWWNSNANLPDSSRVENQDEYAGP